MPEELTPIQVESPTITPAQAIADVAALRDKVAAITPGLIPELLKGDSIEALMSSIDESRAVFERIKGAADAGIAAQEAATTTPTTQPATPPAIVPAGGAAYTEDLNALPPHELIKRGIKQKRQQ